MNTMINIETIISMINDAEKMEMHEEIIESKTLSELFDELIEKINSELGVVPSSQNYSIEDGIKSYVTYEIVSGISATLVYTKSSDGTEDIFGTCSKLGCKIYITKPDSDHVMVNGVVPAFAI